VTGVGRQRADINPCSFTGQPSPGFKIAARVQFSSQPMFELAALPASGSTQFFTRAHVGLWT